MEQEEKAKRKEQLEQQEARLQEVIDVLEKGDIEASRTKVATLTASIPFSSFLLHYIPNWPIATSFV